jgi:hypothetical protein
MINEPPRKRAPPANRQPGGKDYRPAGGLGIGGPARGAGRRPGIGPTSAETMAGRARNQMIADLAMERIDQAFAALDRVLADAAHPQAFAAAKYVLDRVAGTPGASLTVAEDTPSVVTFRWMPEELSSRS